MSSVPFDSFAAFSLVPLILGLLWLGFVLGMTIFMVVMALRFVKAHERIAKHLETLARVKSADLDRKQP